MSDNVVVTNFINTFYSPNSTNHFGPSHANVVKTGNSRFSLTTIGNDGKVNTCTGILSELPEMSFTVNFTEGPGKASQDMIEQLYKNDLFDLINAVGSSSNYKNLMATGNLTTEIYNGLDISDITLKFKIFNNDRLGQTSPNEWIRCLGQFAVPSTDNVISTKNSVKNLISGIRNAVGIGSGIIAMFGNNNTVENFDGSDDQQKDASSTDEITYNANAKYNDKKSTLEYYVKNLVSHFQTADVVEKIKNKRKEEDTDLQQLYEIHTINIEEINNDNNTQHIIKMTGTAGANSKYKFECIFPVWNIDARNDNMNHHLDTLLKNTIINNNGSNGFEINQKQIKECVKKGLKNIARGKTDYADSLAELIVEAFIASEKEDTTNETESEAEREKNNYLKKVNDLRKMFKNLENNANDLQNLAETRFNYYRVLGEFNRSNGFGEKLWYLYIYDNFLFKLPLTVYIKNWEAKPSLEYVDNKPVYVDFNITCSLDQQYSWDQIQPLLHEATLSQQTKDEKSGQTP